MAKKKLNVIKRKVEFTKRFEGSFNDFVIKVQAGDIIDLPEYIYDWILKFKVCKDVKDLSD